MELDNVMKRIKNCMAIAQNAGASENEAATALRQAQALMKKYNISPEGITADEIGPDTIACPSAWSKVPQWEINLACLLAEAFGARVTMRTFPGMQKLAEFTFIGLKHQMPAIKYAYGVLRRQIVTARAAYQKAHCVGFMRGEKMLAGESFCQGFVSRVSKQVDAYAMKPEHVEEINRQVDERTGGREAKQPKKKPLDWDALRAGSEAGSKATLYRPIK
jgi:hypothetical protein